MCATWRSKGRGDGDMRDAIEARFVEGRGGEGGGGGGGAG
jgi:hypothetical protein